MIGDVFWMNWGVVGFIWGVVGFIWGVVGFIWGVVGFIWGKVGLIFGCRELFCRGSFVRYKYKRFSYKHFSPSLSLIEYSVDFSLCQRLNASFDWIFNGFWSFPNQWKHFCALGPWDRLGGEI